MLPAFAKVMSQMTEPRFRAVALKSVLLAIVLYTLLISGGWWLVDSSASAQGGWLDSALDVLGKFAVIVLGIAVFPALVSASVGLFLEEIAAAVEARYYPDLPAPRSQPAGEALTGALRFALVAIGLNLVALPLYLVPGLNVLAFLGLNGYLLGREYFDLVASRRLDARGAKGLRGANTGALWVAGALIAVLLTIPVVNVFAPIVATTFMVHLFETWRRRHGLALESA